MGDDPGTRTRTWSGEVRSAPGSLPALPRRWAAVRQLGEGGQAEVWLAEDIELAEPVAIKLFRSDLSPAARERLRREVRLGRALPHPALVRVFEFIEVADRLAIVMEWVPGGSLAERLNAGPLPIPEVVTAAHQALGALAHLHAQAVVHRDLKPSNLLLGSDGGIKLADLGLARSLSETSNVTRTHTAVGTPAYMSPEQLLGREPMPASDLYALGVTLYEFVTGRRPFDPPDDGADPRLAAPARSPRRLRPDCPRWLARFILRLLEREPRDRFRDAGRALAAFERRRVLVSPRRRRHLLVAGAAAGLALAAGGVLHGLLRSGVVAASAAGSAVIAVNRSGSELWRRDFPGSSPHAVTADVVAGGDHEVVVALRHPDPGIAEGTTDLVVLSSTGQEVASLSSTLSQFQATYPDLAPTTLGPELHLPDLDGDGRPDLVWTASHARWYPTVVGLWSLREAPRGQVALVNSGRIAGMTAADLDADGRPELLAVGINNPLGFQSVVAIVRTSLLAERRAEMGWSSPDVLSRWLLMKRLDPRSQPTYVPLGPFGETLRIERASATGIVLSAHGARIELDPAGNPGGSELWGAGWQPRAAFWDGLVALCRRVETASAEWEPGLATLRAEHPRALAERPTRVAAALLLARSLARSGMTEAAATHLAEAEVVAPDDLDLPLRRGEMLAILGRTAEAESAFQRACRTGLPGRDALDGVVAWSLLAAWHGRDIEPALAVWRVTRANSQADPFAQAIRAMRAFTLADWRSPLLDDDGIEVPFPAVGVLRVWAAAERGAHIEATRLAAERLAANRETAALARLLLAHLASRQGQHDAARALASEVLADLERRGRESWEAFAWVALAERVLADALTAAGRPAEAAPHRTRAHRLAPATWFGEPARLSRNIW